MKRAVLLASALVFAFASASGCARRVAAPPAGSVVVAEGGRLVLATPSGTRTTLSGSLAAARGATVSPDGKHVYFAGRVSAASAWQLFEASLDGTEPRMLTNAPGGATTPAVLGDGTLVYVSPAEGGRVGALWVQAPAGGPARRLTFGPAPVADPTVLADGRVLFVSPQPGSARPVLFAVNLDGTGVLPYALQHDGPSFVRRPRETEDGRVVYLAADAPGGPWRAEAVLTARPWKRRTALAADPIGETIPVAARARMPLGRLSTVNPAKKTGFLLCLDANRTSEGPSPAVRVRILTLENGVPRPLGEVPLAADGSFAAEVPADVPLGIDALDGDGHVLRSLAPWIWVRPGESRGCIGCHEPHGMAPRNRRPLAVKSAPVPVGAAPAAAGRAL